MERVLKSSELAYQTEFVCSLRNSVFILTCS